MRIKIQENIFCKKSQQKKVKIFKCQINGLNKLCSINDPFDLFEIK